MENERDTKKFVREQYTKIAKKGDSCCSNQEAPCDSIEYVRSIGYSEQEIRSVPEGTVMSLGCGNPTALAGLKEGEVVLDIGCGGGLDVFLAAKKVGDTGKVLGLDMTPEMVEKARNNAEKGEYKNVEFGIGKIENLPIGDQSVDVVISNCVINHCPDKAAVFKEVHRCLKPGGRILMSDLVVEGEFSEDILQDEVWGEWIAGACGKQQYLNAISTAGFRDVAIVSESPFCVSEKDSRLKGKIVSIHVKAYK
ncbi:MAG: arsenite methyltransferase [Desulfatiglandales bacterium]